MTKFTGISKIFAHGSVVMNCCSGLFSTYFEKEMSDLWDGFGKIDVHLFYLNDDDEVRPDVKVTLRGSVAYVKLTIYEREFGVRKSETKDFEEENVLKVYLGLHEKAFHIICDRIFDTTEARSVKMKIREKLELFKSGFDPKDSPNFRVQPKRNRQKFWITPPEGVDPSAFRHD